MSRVSAVVLTSRSESGNLASSMRQARTSSSAENGVLATSMRAACERADVAFGIVSGTFDVLMEAVRSWTILPEIIIIDVPEHMEAEDALEKFGACVPEGEAHVMICGVPNDISVYRRLKSLGVVEIYPVAPTEDEAHVAIEAILSSRRDDTGVDPRRAVYIWSCCGGAGGTTLALGVARHYAREGKRTLLLDLDFSTATVSFMLSAEKGSRETHGLIDALSNPGRIDALFLERTIEAAGKNMFYMSARSRGDDDEFQPGAALELIARAQKNFDVVVVDLPWRGPVKVSPSEIQGTSYLVTPPTPGGLLGFSTINRDFEASGTKQIRIAVMNRAGEYKSSDIDFSTFKGDFQGDFIAIPYDGASVGRLFFEQRTLLDASAKVRRAFDKVLATLPLINDSDTKKGRRRLTGFVHVRPDDGLPSSGRGVLGLFGDKNSERKA